MYRKLRLSLQFKGLLKCKRHEQLIKYFYSKVLAINILQYIDNNTVNDEEPSRTYKNLSVRNLLRYFVNVWLPITGIHLHLRANVSGLTYW